MASFHMEGEALVWFQDGEEACKSSRKLRNLCSSFVGQVCHEQGWDKLLVWSLIRVNLKLYKTGSSMQRGYSVFIGRWTFVKEGGSRAYKHMIKFTLNSYEKLRS